MTLGDPYVDLATIKDYLKIEPDNIELDDALEDAIRSASGEIEKMCNRQFNQLTVANSRKYAPGKCGTYVKVDDFYTNSGLIVEVDDSGTGNWRTLTQDVDYDLEPANGVKDGQSGWPFYEIRFFDRVPVCWIDRARKKNTVRVTAKWGWADVPAPVKQACLIIAAETFQMKDAPFGVAGMDQFGNVMRVRDNRVAMGKLARYQRNRIPVA